MQIIRHVPVSSSPMGDGVLRRVERSNLVTNSAGRTDADGWMAFTGATLSAVTDQPETPANETTAIQATLDSDIASSNIAYTTLESGANFAEAGQMYYARLYILAEGTAVGKTANVRLWETGGTQASQSAGDVSHVLTENWTEFVVSGALVQGDRTALSLYIQLTSAADGDVLCWSQVQASKEGFIPYIPTNGSTGTRYGYKEMVVI